LGWRCGSSGRAPYFGPEFKPHPTKEKKKKKKVEYLSNTYKALGLIPRTAKTIMCK
jgi:hypothetical protein